MCRTAQPQPRITAPDVEVIRAAFPLLHERDAHEPVYYLDNAATTHKPCAVIEAISGCYRHHAAPVHRGLYPLAEAASETYEQARARVARFIGAPAATQLVFTRSATEAINMVASGWLASRLQAGDEVWVSRMEHHANLLPWQRACRRNGARLRFIELLPDGTLDLSGAEGLFGPRTRLIALCQVSNVLGTINPVADIVRHAAAAGIPVLVDAAQSVAHMRLDADALNCDFLAFSAHKMCGPGGIGGLYAKAERLEEMEPLLLGGGMVDQVGDDDASWAAYPARFEAGSPDLAGAVGFAAAAEYLDGIGVHAIRDHVAGLTDRALTALSGVTGMRIYGPLTRDQRAGIVAFNLEDIHPHDLAQVLAAQGVAVRAGHHCCQPLMRHLGVPATVRASFALYNRPDEIDALVSGLDAAQRLLG